MCVCVLYENKQIGIGIGLIQLRIRIIGEPLEIQYPDSISYGISYSIALNKSHLYLILGNKPQGNEVIHKRDRSMFGGSLAVSDDERRTVVCILSNTFS